jgi:hypothetical protein
MGARPSPAAVALYQVCSGLPTWLTPTFLRTISALIRTEELLNTGLLNDLVGEVGQRLGLSLLRFASVTFLYTCGGFVLEILGDIRVDWTGDTGSTLVEVSPNYHTTLLQQVTAP